MKKLRLLMLLIFFLLSTITASFRVHKVEASTTIYIRVDGSVEPITANITSADNSSYTFTNDNFDSLVIERDNVVVDGANFTLQGHGTGTGVYLSLRNNVTIINMKILKFFRGMHLWQSTENNVSSNIIQEISSDGILVQNSSNNNYICDNEISNTSEGVFVLHSNNTMIRGNDISESSKGIDIYYSHDNDIIRNNVSNCRSGIFLNFASNNFLRSNIMVNNSFNFGAFFGINSILDCINDIDTSNLVEGKPIYYWVNKKDAEIPSDAGCIYLVNCSNMQVENFNLTNNERAIMLAYTVNSTIRKNIILQTNFAGIKLFKSTGNIVTENHILDCSLDAIYIHYSVKNIVSSNIIGNSVTGMSLSRSEHNVVFRNNISSSSRYGISISKSYNNYLQENYLNNNSKGIRFYNSSDNIIFHNNFVDNIHNVMISRVSTSSWDNGFEGNFWSNYNGTDINHDGIGESSYVIDANNTDIFPLMGVFSSFNTSLGEPVEIISNSTIEDLEYFEFNSTIRMYVSNMTENQTSGFVRISIPHAMMTEPYNITIDGATPTYWNYTLYDNGTHRWIYFAYEHSTLEIIIIPEAPFILVLPLLLLATSLAALVYKKKREV